MTTEQAITHRLLSGPGLLTSICGTDMPGDTLSARPYQVTCDACRAIEEAYRAMEEDDPQPSPRQLRDSANRPWNEE